MIPQAKVTGKRRMETNIMFLHIYLVVFAVHLFGCQGSAVPFFSLFEVILGL